MTQTQLTDAIELLLSCCIMKLTSYFPDIYDISERQDITRGACTDMSDYERGIVQQTICSIACLTANSIDGGMDEGDADVLLDMFSDQCEEFVRINWSTYGHPYRDRMKMAMEHGIVPHSSFCLAYPNARKLAEDFVATLCSLEMGGVEFPSCIETGDRMEPDYRHINDKLIGALESITRVGGNLPDDSLTDKTGPNDAAQRGIMVVTARNIARNAIIEAKTHSVVDESQTV